MFCLAAWSAADTVFLVIRVRRVLGEVLPVVFAGGVLTAVVVGLNSTFNLLDWCVVQLEQETSSRKVLPEGKTLIYRLFLKQPD